MINVSGRGKISIPPLQEDSGRLDIVIEYAKNKTLMLTATNYITRQAMWPLKKHQMVWFEGLLDEGEPGFYYVKLSTIKEVNKPPRS